jgi:hypothetical protein
MLFGYFKYVKFASFLDAESSLNCGRVETTYALQRGTAKGKVAKGEGNGSKGKGSIRERAQRT